MIPIYQMKVIHIEITNACNLECANCTRHIGHHRRPFMMDLETAEKAILSLVTPFTAEWQDFPEGFPGYIGIMGGEPTAHPQLADICKLMQKYVPREKRQFWTDGFRLEERKQAIADTFDEGNVHINRHEDKEVGWHQPLLVAAEEVLSEDREYMWRLIHNCWVQWRWAASITPSGGFFCEVAASLNRLFGEPAGYPIKPGWWAKNPNEFMDQVQTSCTRCSAAIPMPAVSAHDDFDLVSPGNLARLKKVGSPRARENVVVFDQKLTREEIEKNIRRGWAPWDHRSYQVYGDGQRIRQTHYRPDTFKKEDGGKIKVTSNK